MPIDIRDCTGFDMETCLIRKGLPFPPPVCSALCDISGPSRIFAGRDQWQPLLELFAGKRLIVGHNVAYDVGVLIEYGPRELTQLIFDAYDADRIFDTMLAQRLVEIETGDRRGRLSLDQTAASYGLEVPKDVTDAEGREVRMSYGHLLNRPLSEYPPEYKEYALNDPRMTVKVFERILARELVKRADLATLGRTHFGLTLTSAFGLRTDATRVQALEVQALTTMHELQGLMIEHKFMRRERGKADPVRTMKNIRRAVAEAYDLADLLDEKGQNYSGDDLEDLQGKGIITKTGAMSTSRGVLEESGEPLLETLAEYGEWSAVLNKDLKLFRHATEIPFHTRFGFAATTRTTSSGPNCFDGATEILTQGGWVRFDALPDETPVAQWDAGQISFLRPQSVTRQHYSGDMLRISTEQQIDMLVTPNHRCPVVNRKTGALRVVLAEEYPQDVIQPQAGEFHGGTHSESESLLRMVLAFQADGSVTNGRVTFGFTRQRKIVSMRRAIADLGWQCNERRSARGCAEFYFPAKSVGAKRMLELAPDKLLPTWLLDLDWQGLTFVCDEIWEWDGCSTRKNHYASNEKHNADIVQALLCMRGWRGRERVYQGPKNPSYQVDVSRKGYSLTTNRKIERVPWDAKVYCVTVPSGLIVVRRGQNVFVSGNTQNFRKKAGIRECIRPAYGAFVASDYTGLENGTLAQVIYWTLGRSGMADKISQGHDFHVDFGSHIMGGIGYDEMLRLVQAKDPKAKKARGAAKPLNFGCPGGMKKPATIQSYARIGYGVDLPTERWAELIALWYSTQHDQVAYLTEYVSALRNSRAPGSLYTVPIPGTTITRRGATYTSAANTGFQGLGAQVAGRSLYLVARAQTLGLMPGRLCAFVHDENISDCAPEDVEQVRYMQEKLMLQAAEERMPNVKMEVDSVAMDRWSKAAEATYDATGQMLVTLV